MVNISLQIASAMGNNLSKVLHTHAVGTHLRVLPGAVALAVITSRGYASSLRLLCARKRVDPN